MQIFLCIVASVLSSMLVTKIQTMKYFDVIDDHVNKIMEDILTVVRETVSSNNK